MSESPDEQQNPDDDCPSCGKGGCHGDMCDSCWKSEQSDERKGNCPKCLIGQMVNQYDEDGEWLESECENCAYRID
jgi:hypothetical protein